MIKPIETHYKGCRFRSRLEARWAVFFDSLGVKWEYEPEGFELSCGGYLPDFRVKCWGNRELGLCAEAYDLFVEVKGVMSASDRKKIIEFSASYPLLVVGNIPVDEDDFFFGSVTDDFFFNFSTVDGDWYTAIPTAASGGRFFLMGPDYVTDDGIARLKKALYAARSARFEHGEKP